MSCDQIQESLSLYADDGLTLEERSACYEHLEVCPVCRAHVDEIRAIRRGLATLSRPLPPAGDSGGAAGVAGRRRRRGGSERSSEKDG